MKDIGVVVIGRNEGARLIKCLKSVLTDGCVVVYVDSASTDGSCDAARELGATVHALDMSRPFSAARARNEGWRLALRLNPELKYIQFVDGDCEVFPDWLSAGRAFLESTHRAAAACGRLKERFPEASIYNLLCDIEWDTPVGLTRSFGGIVMVRTEVLLSVNGYREDFIAGEEPELCVRIRQQGWEIWRLDASMAWHDAAIMRFGQWWTRAKRGGYALALGRQVHGAPPERHYVDEMKRALRWGLYFPCLVLLAAVVVSPWALSLLGIYLLQMARIVARSRLAIGEAAIYALFMQLAKFAETQGYLLYWNDRLNGRTPVIIEYK